MVCNFYGIYAPEDKKRFQLAQEDDLVKICDYLKTDVSKLKQAKIEVFDSREGKQNADPNHSISRARARFGEMTTYDDEGTQATLKYAILGSNVERTVG